MPVAKINTFTFLQKESCVIFFLSPSGPQKVSTILGGFYCLLFSGGPQHKGYHLGFPNENAAVSSVFLVGGVFFGRPSPRVLSIILKGAALLIILWRAAAIAMPLGVSE